MHDYEGMELSTQILIKEALSRKIKVDIIDMDDNFIRLKSGSKTEYVKQATKTSADSYISSLVMENKEVTKHILRENGISVPEGTVCKSTNEALALYERFRKTDIVIKPKSTNFGLGISILKANREIPKDAFMNAVDFAFKHDRSVMIEKFAAGREFRFLVIGNETAAVLHRVPANVTGDGLHTIEELVDEKNRDPLRGKGYKTPLEKISLGMVERDFLGFQGKDIHYVPAEGETVYLRENSNISTGGDSIDFTDEVNEGYKAIAVRAAKAVGANICGADIIIRDINAKPDNGNHSVIELNFNPALHIHDFPFKGKNRQVEKKVLDLLGFREDDHWDYDFLSRDNI